MMEAGEETEEPPQRAFVEVRCDGLVDIEEAQESSPSINKPHQQANAFIADPLLQAYSAHEESINNGGDYYDDDVLTSFRFDPTEFTKKEIFIDAVVTKTRSSQAQASSRKEQRGDLNNNNEQSEEGPEVLVVKNVLKCRHCEPLGELINLNKKN